MKKPAFDVAMKWSEDGEFLLFFQSKELAAGDAGSYFYDISLESLKDAAARAEWICHLGEKNWFTDEAKAEFVRLVEEKIAASTSPAP
jgi:hypothetical protein